MVPDIKPVCTGLAKMVEADIIQLIGGYDITIVKYFRYHPTYLIGLL